jgi:hypothetical protein
MSPVDAEVEHVIDGAGDGQKEDGRHQKRG